MYTRSSTRKFGIVVGVVAALLLAACGADPLDLPDQPVPSGQRAEVPLVGQAGYEDLAKSRDVAAERAWSIALELAQHEEIKGGEANSITSGTGLYLALAMVGEGTAGDLATELDEYLGLSGQERRNTVNLLLRELEYLDGDPADANKDELPEESLLHIANQVVVDDDWELTQQYIDAVMAAFGATVATVDLGSQEGKDFLDAWVNRETGGLVEQSAVQPNPDLALVFQNALTMAARWELPFDASDTFPRNFTLADGTEVEAESMSQLTGLRYATQNGWQAVRLGYRDGLFSDVILPPEGQLPEELTLDTLRALQDSLGRAAVEQVQLQLPKLDLTTSADLLPYLREQLPLQVKGVAGGFANMLETNKDAELVLDQAVQQAVLRVDEEGTVAAVVTELAYAESSAPMSNITFRVDRPYLFTISEETTGWPILVANVGDPRG